MRDDMAFLWLVVAIIVIVAVTVGAIETPH